MVMPTISSYFIMEVQGDQIGFYNVNSSVFKPYDEDKNILSELITYQSFVKQKSAISSMIYTQKYFESRPFILNRYTN